MISNRFARMYSSKFSEKLLRELLITICQWSFKSVLALQHHRFWYASLLATKDKSSPKGYKCYPENNQCSSWTIFLIFIITAELGNLMKDSMHLRYQLFALIPSEHCFCRISSRNNHLRDSFYSWFMRKMNAGNFQIILNVLLFHLILCILCVGVLVHLGCAVQLFIVHCTVSRRINK